MFKSCTTAYLLRIYRLERYNINISFCSSVEEYEEKFNNSIVSFNTSSGFKKCTLIELKKELSKRGHILNKKDAKLKRQKVQHDKKYR